MSMPADDSDAAAGTADQRFRAFDRWAPVLCYVLAALGLYFGVLALSSGVTGVTHAISIAATFIGAAVLLIVARGVSRSRSWGRPAAVLLLWVLIVLGVGRLLLVLGLSGAMTVPLEAIVSGLVLVLLPAGERRNIGWGPDRTMAIRLAVAYAAASLIPLLVR